MLGLNRWTDQSVRRGTVTSTASVPAIRVTRWLTTLLVGIVAVAGCSRTPGAASPGASTGTTRALSQSGVAAEQTRYVCIDGHASFTIEEIEGAPAADIRADPAWELLQSLLGEQAGVEESHLPKDGWRRVVDTPEEVVLLAETPDAEEPYAVVHVVPGDGGAINMDGWGVDSFGGCLPRIDVPDDVSVADWWVDPDAEPIGPASESIPALVLENACASGNTAEGRISPPMIIYGATEVTITIVVRSLGDAECPGHPPTPYTIELAEPLGDRTLADGGSFPLGDPLEEPVH